jgi:hypothetical protein
VYEGQEVAGGLLAAQGDALQALDLADGLRVSTRDDGGDAWGDIVADRAQSFERHVAALELPFVVLFEQQC